MAPIAPVKAPLSAIAENPSRSQIQPLSLARTSGQLVITWCSKQKASARIALTIMMIMLTENMRRRSATWRELPRRLKVDASAPWRSCLMIAKGDSMDTIPMSLTLRMLYDSITFARSAVNCVTGTDTVGSDRYLHLAEIRLADQRVLPQLG